MTRHSRRKRQADQAEIRALGLPQALTNLRLTAGYTSLRQAATKGGISPSTLSEWENGKKSPTAETMSVYLVRIGSSEAALSHELDRIYEANMADNPAIATLEQLRENPELLDQVLKLIEEVDTPTAKKIRDELQRTQSSSDPPARKKK